MKLEITQEDMVKALQLWADVSFTRATKVTAIESGGTQGNNGFKVYLNEEKPNA